MSTPLCDIHDTRAVVTVVVAIFPLQSPKAVLGNRFIVVAISEVNLIEPDPYYVDPVDAAETEEAAAKAEAAAALTARKRAYEILIVSCWRRGVCAFFCAFFFFSSHNMMHGFPVVLRTLRILYRIPYGPLCCLY